MMVSCQYSFLCGLQLVSRHVIEVQEIGFKKFGTELRRGWPPADFSWQCYYMLGNNKLSVLFQLSSGVVVTLERFLGLGVTVSEINIKKVKKQDLKNIKNVKGCKDSMPKSMQTR